MSSLLTAFRRSPVLLVFLFVATWIGLLSVGLWPFDFSPGNRTTWLKGQNGVRFDGYGLIRSVPTPAGTREDLSHNARTVEIWLRSSQRLFDYNEIVCLGPDFILAQSGRDLVVEGKFLESDGRWQRKRIFLANAVAGGADRLITITSDQNQALIFLDSTVQRTLSPIRFGHLFERVVIGHSPTRNDPWSGDLLGFGIYRTSLSSSEVEEHLKLWKSGNWTDLAGDDPIAVYPLDERKGSSIHNRIGSGPDLEIPAKFHKTREAVLGHRIPFDSSELIDILINIIGFIPLGFLLWLLAHYVYHVERTQSVILALSAGLLTSLLIELLQVYLPTRDSSLIDVITNSLGTTVGAIAATRLKVASLTARSHKGASPSLVA